MAESKESTTFEQLARRIDPQSTLLRTWQLHGGVSARVTALEILLSDGQTKKMVVRRHGKADLATNPQVAADEFRLLQVLRSAGIPVPTPIYLDRSGDIFATPCIVVEYIEGESVFSPSNVAGAIHQLAAQLISIHTIDGARPALSFLPRQEELCAEKLARRPATLDESLCEGRIRDALEAARPLEGRHAPVVLHGDFWPGNVLWRDGRLVAIIDWEDAAVGDPLADLANSRLEILWAFGIDAMHGFTEQYRSMTAVDLSNLPYWDLWAALRPASKLGEWGLDADAERAMREGHRWFITQACDQLSVR